MTGPLNDPYSHFRLITRATTRNNLSGLFDKPPIEKSGATTHRYTGSIADLPARITFIDDSRYYVSTQRPEHLPIVYGTLLDRLSRVSGN